MLPCVCSVIDHRGRQNVVRASVTHRVPLFWSCQHGVYLLIRVIFFLRLVHADDELNATEYPLQVFKHRGKRLRCRVCGVYTAR